MLLKRLFSYNLFFIPECNKNNTTGRYNKNCRRDKEAELKLGMDLIHESVSPRVESIAVLNLSSSFD